MVSLSTLMGTVCGIAIVAWGVLSATSRWEIFLSLSSLQIVLGGTLTAAFIGYRWRYILLSLMAIPKIFIRQKITPQSLVNDVDMVVHWAEKVRQDGIMAYEHLANESEEPFIKYLFNLAGTGYKPDEIRAFAETSIEEHYFRHLNESNILQNMAAAAPAFGMVGTLIGLIVMLGELEDPSKMGPGLSMALMTTLYGVLFARFLFQPASTKVKQILGIQRFREYLLLEGLLLILQKRSPFFIQDRLNSFLDRKTQSRQAGVSNR